MKKTPEKVEISVAPMVGWTNQFGRYLYRLLSKNVVLYTEMAPTGAILHSQKRQLLNYDPTEEPLVLQLAGSDLNELALCANIATEIGYKEINLNVGCPSKRAQAGGFGACLMAEPKFVADCVAVMSEKSRLPISVKTRLGLVEGQNSELLYSLVELLLKIGCKKIIVHARNAKLKGTNPKQNRNMMPLQYEAVYKLKRDYPKMNVIINGGINSIEDINFHLKYTDGVMIGRAVCNNPYLLAHIEQNFFGKFELPSREEISEKYLKYAEEQAKNGVPKHLLLRSLIGLYRGTEYAKKWRSSIVLKDLAQILTTTII